MNERGASLTYLLSLKDHGPVVAVALQMSERNCHIILSNSIVIYRRKVSSVPYPYSNMAGNFIS